MLAVPLFNFVVRCWQGGIAYGCYIYWSYSVSNTLQLESSHSIYHNDFVTGILFLHRGCVLKRLLLARSAWHSSALCKGNLKNKWKQEITRWAILGNGLENLKFYSLREGGGHLWVPCSRIAALQAQLGMQWLSGSAGVGVWCCLCSQLMPCPPLLALHTAFFCWALLNHADLSGSKNRKEKHPAKRAGSVWTGLWPEAALNS